MQKMVNFDDISKENKKNLNSNWPQVPDHPYGVLTTRGSESRKTNSLFNLISHQLGIDKIYLHAKDADEVKYQLLINQQESAGLKYLSESKAFVEYSNDMGDL